jgi:hypothetical protein
MTQVNQDLRDRLRLHHQGPNNPDYGDGVGLWDLGLLEPSDTDVSPRCFAVSRFIDFVN